MNRFTLLLFLCVFALSEVLLAAQLSRYRGVAEGQNSSNVRFARSTFRACDYLPDDSQCDRMCKYVDAYGGQVDLNDPLRGCICGREWKPVTLETCVAQCKDLHFKTIVDVSVGDGVFCDCVIVEEKHRDLRLMQLGCA
ncbi:hypothetical protein Ddc_12946 [Ditylenchus destructor]|nr:hypothetical protein Ddc_12946 [Ditylenchus destructor]